MTIKGGGGRRLMENTILNFHFDYWNTSLICLAKKTWTVDIQIAFPSCFEFFSNNEIFLFSFKWTYTPFDKIRRNVAAVNTLIEYI